MIATNIADACLCFDSDSEGMGALVATRQSAARRTAARGRGSAAPAQCRQRRHVTKRRATLTDPSDDSVLGSITQDCKVWGERVDGVVLPHTNADFDSLASAVGLARLRDHTMACEGATAVVLPQGANPTVQRFLALHKNYFPIKSHRLVDPENLNWLAVCDAQRRDRFGQCAAWLDLAKEVTVFDHHVDQTSDINADNMVLGDVGAVTTLVVERLVEAGVVVDEQEATLLALGIHSDTGSLVFECTTPRDARALQYCLECGASQKAIMQFSRVQMSLEQRNGLNIAMRNQQIHTFERVSLLWSHVECDEYLPGMATVARELMELNNVDVVLLAVSYTVTKKKKKGKASAAAEDGSPSGYQHVSIIGRGSAELEALNLSHLLAGLNGGGHAKAAATSFRMDRLHQLPDPEFSQMKTVEELCEAMVARLCATQIPPVKTAANVMTPVENLVCVQRTTNIMEAMSLLIRYEFHSLPVVDEDGALWGVVSLGDLERELKNGRGDIPVQSCMEAHLYLAEDTTSLPDIERVFIEKEVGCVPVVECPADGAIVLGERSKGNLRAKVVGMITRTDVLREHRFYSTLSEGAMSFTYSDEI